jgi:hypothetical protein
VRSTREDVSYSVLHEQPLVLLSCVVLACTAVAIDASPLATGDCASRTSQADPSLCTKDPSCKLCEKTSPGTAQPVYQCADQGAKCWSTDFMTHVADTGETGDDFIRPRDIHVFASDPKDLGLQGGTIAVTNTNGTVNDYEMSFGPMDHETRTFGMRNISATLTTSSSNKTHTYTGMATFIIETTTRLENVQLKSDPSSPYPLASLFAGPNPPPPPPRPPQCTAAHNRTACEQLSTSLGSCVWCTSDDQLHALCFDASHLPTSGWTCMRKSE